MEDFIGWHPHRARSRSLALHMIGPPPAAAATRSASSHKPRSERTSVSQYFQEKRRLTVSNLVRDLWHETNQVRCSFLPPFRCRLREFSVRGRAAGSNICPARGGRGAQERHHHFWGIFFFIALPASRPLSVLGLIKLLSLLL